MTLEELEATLPNGFHDAELLRLELDYVHRIARFDLDVWVGDVDDPPGPQREARRLGVLELRDLLFCVIEPPDPRYPYTDQSDMTEFVPVEQPTVLPEGAFEARTFVTQWNSFIHVAAFDASIHWLDESPRPGGGG